MSTFIESAACRGRRPQGLVARVHHSRSELVARLLRERRVARFLVAPDGFGKTSLAYAYADVVFSFAHVFWLSCRSPCFLRDLDAGLIGPDVLRLDESASLVVFEDLPRLDVERAASFSGLLDALLERGVEVIVSCAPSCDVYGGLQQGRLVLAGADLLLTPAEWRVSLRGEDANADGSVPPAAERVACLRWKEAGEADLLAGLRREELPSDLLLAVFALLVLGEGDLDDLGAFLSAGRQRTEEVVELLARGYPFLGVERRDGSFSAARVSVGGLAETMGPLFDLLVQASAFEGRDALAGRFADALVVRGEHARAMELALAFATKQGASSWVALRGWRYLADGRPLPLRQACDALARSSFKKNPSYNALAAWAACELADAAGAVAFARRAAFGQTTPRAEVLLSCVLLLREGPQDRDERVLRVLEAQVSRSSGISEEAGEPTAGEWVDAEALGRLAFALHEGPASGLATWLELAGSLEAAGEGPDPREAALLMAASWLLEDAASGRARLRASRAADGEGPDRDAVDEADLLRVARFAVSCVDRGRGSPAHASWCEHLAFSALEGLSKAMPELSIGSPGASALARLRRFELSLLAQREGYRKSCARRDRQMSEFYETHPNVFRDDARTAPATTAPARVMAPMLHVSLFGSMELRLGDEVVDPKLIRQQKVKVLLAVLVLARGREVTRDRLAQMLWPKSAPASARKNLYSTWSKLSRALTVEGSCPYLIRDQLGCRVNARLVTSDVAEFESICRTLLFGKSEELEWEKLYTSVEESFADELMPTEVENETIVALRDKYHVQLLDALLVAASRLMHAGEAQGALWFAREALRRDRTREDAYATLMEAQIAAGQRGAAIDTFFACRRYLADELGIDPSPRIVGLYRSVIEVEEPL